MPTMGQRVASVLEAFRGKNSFNMTLDEILTTMKTVAVADGPKPGVSEDTYWLGRALAFLEGQESVLRGSPRRKVRQKLSDCRARLWARPDIDTWITSASSIALAALGDRPS